MIHFIQKTAVAAYHVFIAALLVIPFPTPVIRAEAVPPPAGLAAEEWAVILHQAHQDERHPTAGSLAPSQVKKLTASDGAAGDSFGRPVALSGEAVVVGASGADVGGSHAQAAAYIFAREGVVETEWASPAASRLSPEFRISQPTSPECARYYPKVAYDWVHREYLVVWYNWWSLDFHDIYAQRVTSTGELKSHFTVATGANGDEKARFHPALAYNASAGEYLVVYMYDALGDGIHYEVWGRRVAWDGSWLGPEFQIFTWANRAFWTPRVAWNSYRNEYLVVANAMDTTTGLWNDVAGRRVMADGSTPYPGHNISSQNQTLQPHQADVAYNLAADEYLVVWRQRWAGDDWDIYGARVRGDNDAVVNPPGEFIIDATAVDQRYPAIATNQQDRYLVVWQHGEGLPTTDWEIYGRELDITGGWASTHIQVAVSTDYEQYPAIAINGAANERFVVWRPSLTGGEYQIRGFGWDPSAAWILWLPFQIASNTAWTPPVVASGPPGYLVVYGKIEGTAIHIYGRLYWPAAVYLPIILHQSP